MKAGIADPYWYEWYVGLRNIVKMLNPDNKILHVTFQKQDYGVLDDVVVTYDDGNIYECFQIKHLISESNESNLTFNTLIEESRGRTLLNDMAQSWHSIPQNSKVKPILYTNKKLGCRKTSFDYNGIKFSAESLLNFIKELKAQLVIAQKLDDIVFKDDMKKQWLIWRETIKLNDSDTFLFLKEFEISHSMPDKDTLEKEIVFELSQCFKCNNEKACYLFEKLVVALRNWTTTSRKTEEITTEDVYNALVFNLNHPNTENHRLVPPRPFFNSRISFCKDLVDIISKNYHPYVFMHGVPGCGKTSIVSELQLKFNLFSVRYHTFRPISPEQRFYDQDDGLCDTHLFWSEILNQLRKFFSGEFFKHQIPVSNLLCSNEQLRSESLRLLHLLAEKEGSAIFICIDGIDHAARSKKDVTFLTSLPLPDEVPSGVTFFLVGQPTQMYPQYPKWLREDNKSILFMGIPSLIKDDIKQLVSDKIINLKDNVELISQAIYEKTKGNNLSVVFAVEEVKKSNTTEELLSILSKDHLSNDVENYYSYIWNHVTRYLDSKLKSAVFPEITLASAILLLNGRINTLIFHRVLKSWNLSIDEWNYLLDNLHPLLISSLDHINMYNVFHNDFRVFLMSLISQDNKIYQATALQLAEYYYAQEASLDKTTNLFELLLCAKRPDLIAKWFDNKFVIEALSEGISYNTLFLYAEIAYKTCCENKWIKYYQQVYFAFNTIRQHLKYYQWLERAYYSIDNSKIRTLDNCELSSVALIKENLYSYKYAIDWCKKLMLTYEEDCISRASFIYELWYDKLNPKDFIDFADNREIVSKIIQAWGECAAYLGKNYFTINENDTMEEKNIICKFNDSYLQYLFDAKQFDKAVELTKYADISYQCIENQIEIIFKNNLYSQFKNLLFSLSKTKSIISKLLCIAMITFNEKDYKTDLSKLDIKIDYISDSPSYQAVLKAYILGSQEYLSDNLVIIGHVNNFLSDLKKDTWGLDYLKEIIKISAMLGKCEKCLQNNINLSKDTIQLMNNYYNYFFNNYPRRSFDFTKAYNFLLNKLLNSPLIDAGIDVTQFTQSLKYCLFNAGMIGMYFKNYILSFLIKNNKVEIVKDYFYELFGENAEKLTTHENYAEMVSNFKLNGETVVPLLMQRIYTLLKWDVVNFTGHKEGALSFALNIFNRTSIIDSNIYNDIGKRLIDMSYMADIANGNGYHEQIIKSVCNAAINDSLSSYWDIHNYNSDVCYSEYYLFDQLLCLIEQCKNKDDLRILWGLSCGIHSWYFKNDVSGLYDIFAKICEKYDLLGLGNFFDDAISLTPEYIQIVNSMPYTNSAGQADDTYSNYNKDRQKERDYLENLSKEKLIDCLSEISSLDSHKLITIWKILDKKKVLDDNSVNSIKSAFLTTMSNVTWERYGCKELLYFFFDYYKEDFLWEIATTIKNYLFEYDCYTAVENMEFILDLYYNNKNKSDQLALIQESFDCYTNWITGNGQLSLPLPKDKIKTNLVDPQNLLHLSLNILLEQIDLHSACKTENAIVGINILSKIDSSIVFSILSQNWNQLSEFQKQSIYKLAEYWCHASLKNDTLLYDVLLEEYKESNDLAIKYQLFLILNTNRKLNNQNELAFEMQSNSIGYALSSKRNSMFHSNNMYGSQDAFIHLTSSYMNDESFNNDIIKYCRTNEKPPTYQHETYIRKGDSKLPIVKDGNLTSQVLYGEEQKGRYKKVPLEYKMQWLLPFDDGYLITNPPFVVLNKTIDKIEESATESSDLNKLLNPIYTYGLSDNEILIFCNSWMPYKYNKGVILKKHGVLVRNPLEIENFERTITFGKYSLQNEISVPYAIGLDAYYPNNVPLFHDILGTGLFVHGCCQAWPSFVFKKIFQWTPSKTNPLKWYDKDNEECMRFEKLIFTQRDTIQEQYFHQPYVLRWVADKNKLEKKLSDMNLYLKYKISKEPFPF